MKKLNILIIFLLFVSFAYSAPPVTQVGTSSTGYEIKFPPFEYIKQNSFFEFEVHVYNATNGVPITENTGCYFHLYNSSGKHIVELIDNTPSHNFDYGFNVGGGNFTRIGSYSYVIQCNSTIPQLAGGFVSHEFEVTKDGEEDVTKANNYFLLGMLLTPILLAFFFIYWSNSIADEHNPIKWFMRLLALLLVFVEYQVIYLILSLSEYYSRITSAFSVYIYGWIFWVIFVYFLIYLIYKIFMSFKHNKTWEWNKRFVE